MCKVKKYHGTSNTRIDKCMVKLTRFINDNSTHETLACCCGHGKYPMTVVVRHEYDFDDRKIFELISGVEIKRTRNFYKRDKQGYYFIPEVIGNSK